MFYIEQLGVDYLSVDNFLHAMILDAPDSEYALSFLEDLLLEIFPDVAIDLYNFDYHWWNEYEGVYCIEANYEFTYDLTALQQSYPEYFI